MMTALRLAVLAAAAACAVLAAGCQALPAAPEHKYYRPQAAATLPLARPLLEGGLVVKPLRADGLYAERAMIFGDESRRELQQYHYHHWLYPPGQLVQEYLAQRLRQAAVAPVVRLQANGAEADYTLSGRVVRFEKSLAAGRASAVAVLELRLEHRGRMLWERNYAASEAVTEDGANGLVLAMERALDRIYGELAAELGRAGREG